VKWGFDVDTHDRERLRVRLGEVLAWLDHEKPFVAAGEVVTRTSRLNVDEEFAADHTRSAVRQIVARRAALLAEAAVRSDLPAVLPAGRVLLLLTDRNLKDGSALHPSGQVIGEFNVPSCDTWIDFFEQIPSGEGSEPAIACWIPKELVHLVQRAVDVNPEECLVWADEFTPGFVRGFAS
jgi:hypothetical protein